MTKYRTKLPFALLLLATLVLPAGCNIIGAVAGKMPKPDIEAAYKGLVNQSVGVMVWVDRETAIQWPSMQLDLAGAIETKLKEAQKAEIKDLAGTTFPWPAASYIKYRQEHPEIDSMPITDVAPRFKGVTRLLFVEVNGFATRAEGTTQLYLGTMDVTMRMIEIEGGKGTIAFEEAHIGSKYPESATKDGVLGSNDSIIYRGSIGVSSTNVVKRLIQHPDDSKE